MVALELFFLIPMVLVKVQWVVSKEAVPRTR